MIIELKEKLGWSEKCGRERNDEKVNEKEREIGVKAKPGCVPKREYLR